MRFLQSYGIAFVIVVAIAGWMLTGTLIQGGRGPGQGETAMVDAVDGEGAPLRGMLESIGLVQPVDPDAPAQETPPAQEPEQALTTVRIARVEGQDLPELVQLRGRTEANAIVAARAETSGTVRQVHVRKGDTVEAGTLLCTLDQGTRQVRLNTAEAQLAQAQADLDNNVALRERGVAPANTARQFEVALLSAQAAYDDALAELERTEIYAEAGGIVQDPIATQGNALSAGAECATIIQLDPIVFRGEVPEARVGQISVGEPAQITTVTGQEVLGTVRYVSASADPATRTFSVEIEVANPDAAIRDGVTARAMVEVGTTRAHLVPQSVLTLDNAGVLGARTVEDGVVAFHPVAILRDSREGAWVSGLPDDADVITVGQEYVQEGQAVNAVHGTAAGSEG